MAVGVDRPDEAVAGVELFGRGVVECVGHRNPVAVRVDMRDQAPTGIVFIADRLDAARIFDRQQVAAAIIGEARRLADLVGVVIGVGRGQDDRQSASGSAVQGQGR